MAQAVWRSLLVYSLLCREGAIIQGFQARCSTTQRWSLCGTSARILSAALDATANPSAFTIAHTTWQWSCALSSRSYPLFIKALSSPIVDVVGSIAGHTSLEASPTSVPSHRRGC
ncbi:hypothetical protein BCR34DRAFT_113200 [Clohesyomyces aquaticus]|uniref:Secreted protein n=1 Tax=Clohesyomyces aquaticus TaxID=1231657 RepID=A0A1Y1YQR9_9PLEO|nr:hypothetical protein BCR34DRAFT_113200 [Clohesyomyces aquaticus]